MNTELDIKFFETLDGLWEKHGPRNNKGKVLKKQLAALAGLPESRLSEFRKISILRREGDNSKVGRLFTIADFVAIAMGLKDELGDELVKKELETMLAKIKNPKQRMILKILNIKENDEAKAEAMLDVFLRDE